MQPAANCQGGDDGADGDDDNEAECSGGEGLGGKGAESPEMTWKR